MSYRRSWLLVDGMNRCWRDRLVETVAGGGQGRAGAGCAVLTAYRALEAGLADTANGAALADLDAMLRAEPLLPVREGV